MTEYEAFQSVDESHLFYDEYEGVFYTWPQLEDVLRGADNDNLRYAIDDEGNIQLAEPTESYDPMTDLPFDILDLTAEERESLEDDILDLDEDRLAELEEEAGIWDDPEKFTLSVVIRDMGELYDYLLAEAKRSFSQGDHISKWDIDELLNSDNVEIDLSDEEYEKIAMEATGNSLADDDEASS